MKIYLYEKVKKYGTLFLHGFKNIAHILGNVLNFLIFIHNYVLVSMAERQSPAYRERAGGPWVFPKLHKYMTVGAFKKNDSYVDQC